MCEFSPKQEIQQLTVMLARAWVIIDEIHVHGHVRSTPLFSQSWVEIGEAIPSDLVDAVLDTYLSLCEKKGIDPCPGSRENPRLPEGAS